MTTLFSLVYVSDELVSFTDDSLQELAEQATESNQRNEITGYLSWKNGRFFQYLEGAEQAVRHLLERIEADPRHAIARVLELGEIEARRFPNWGMRFVRQTESAQIRVQDLLESIMRSMRDPVFDRERTCELVERMVTDVSHHVAVHQAAVDSLGVEPLQPERDDGASEPDPMLVAGIGASAGGLRPLQEIFKTLPDKLPVCFVVIQHFSPETETVMDSILQRETGMTVCSASDGMTLTSGSVYVIPPGTDLKVSGGKFQLTRQERTGRGPQFPIDIFFRSMAAEYGPRAVAVVLSGTGSDGSRGISAVHEADGVVLAQSLESSEFDGMPRAAAETGLVLQSLKPFEIAHFIERMVIDGKRRTGELNSKGKLEYVRSVVAEMTDSDIDFSHYKEDTLFRRIERRRVLARIDERAAYVEYFRTHPDEQMALRDDLLITVTSFFRDPAVWSRLRTEVIPSMAEDLDDHDFLRAWVTACATGEEAYSLAIVLTEALEQFEKFIDFKVYATDIEHRALEQAGTGWYSERALEDVSPERLSRFFIPKNNGYTVSRELRSRVIFAPHNLVTDAPFTRMHLVTCRNVLIYMRPELQQQVLKTLHFSLNIKGVLTLGMSETLGGIQSEFLAVCRESNIYRKLREFRLPLHLESGRLRKLKPSAPAHHPVASSPETVSSFASTSLKLLARASDRTAVLVDDNRQTLYVIADPHALLTVQLGEPSRDLCRMVPPGLVSSLTIAIKSAMRDMKPMMYHGIRCFPDSDDRQAMNLEVFPQADTGTQYAQQALVLFSPVGEPSQPDQPPATDGTGSSQVERLQAELEQTRNSLQLAINELESSSDIERSTNEQLIASNEELQSTNEELQSVNQELYTVNFEYQSKIHELSDLNHDLDNLLRSTNLGVIFLDGDLRIRRFTDVVTRSVNLLPSDIGRPFADIAHELDIDDLGTELNRALSIGTENAFRVRSRKTGELLRVGIHPYRVGSDLAQGVLITFLRIVNGTGRDSKPIEEPVMLDED